MDEIHEENYYSPEIVEAVKRQRRNIRDDSGIRDIVIMQCILCVILCIIMLLLHMFSPDTAQMFLSALKEKSMDTERLIIDAVSYLGEVLANAG